MKISKIILNIHIFVLNFCLAVILPQVLLSQEPGVQQITVTGVSAIYQNDIAHARDRAIDDGLRKAVEQSLGMWLKSETVVENYMVVEDNILNWSSGYVKNYTIVSESQKPDDTYEVRMNAAVEAAALAQDQQMVQSILERAGNPRIMIMINEQNVGEVYSASSFFNVDMTQAETAMMDKFIEKGFEVVDPATVRANVKREQALAALQGDAKAAAAIGTQLHADVVITGKAIAKTANLSGNLKNVMGDMKSCQANLTVRVVKADVGTVIATQSEHAAHPHIDEISGGMEAIKKASVKASDALIKKIISSWRDEFYNQTTVKLRIVGVEYSDLNAFKGILSTFFRGVKSVYQRNYAAGTAELDVKITGTADQLSRELERKVLDDYSVKVTGVTRNQISCNISRKSETEY